MIIGTSNNKYNVFGEKLQKYFMLVVLTFMIWYDVAGILILKASADLHLWCSFRSY